MNKKLIGRLPVRDGISSVSYSRNPTQSEIRFGEGATHYKQFSLDDCCHKGTRIAKKWFVANDGLRYYR